MVDNCILSTNFSRTIFKGCIVHVGAFMKLIIGLIIFSVLVAGCISPDVKTGDPLQYELPGMENTTIFYLNLSSTQVIDNVINQTSVDYRIDDSIQTFRNPVAVDYRGNNASLNVTIKTIMGRNYAHFNFSTNFSGFVAYTRPGGQDFTYIPEGNRTIRVVLPENFTAGTMFLGYIQPDPDNITHDALGREVLIWNNSVAPKIRVRYHNRDTPELLLYMFGFLLICAVIVWVYYYFSISALKRKRKMLERNIKK